MRLLWFFTVLCVIFGLLYRLLPVALGPDWLARFFITEDGYLMLTVARNLADGAGLSVSDGEIATNGVQPLGTFLYALPYLATGGDKVTSLVGVILIMALVSVFALFAIRAFAARSLAGLAEGPIWAWMVAALWFLGPLMLFHSMNALETGLATLAVVALLLWFGNLCEAQRPFTVAERIVLGLLSGLVFLARIDCAFLVTAIFAVHFARCLLTGGGLGRALRDLTLPGLISLAMATPWLVYNKVGFGSIMPISGTAQSLTAEFGQNLGLLPAKLFETMFPMLPIPGALESALPVQVICGLSVVGVLVVFAGLSWSRRRPFHAALLAYGLYGVAIAFYYGALFGAPHFLSRYLAPLGPLLIIAAITVALTLFERVSRHGPAITGALSAASLVLCIALLGVKLAGGLKQGHFQVVEWVDENVPDDVWVGAVQTGTLGYWHDRTINLDGKVNPEALAAIKAQGSVLDYVVDSPITYLADWSGIAGWVDNPRFAEAFELLVMDEDRNLGVLRRRDSDPVGS
ncbi:hypothetical protein [Roseovarius salinarum]|uniref:hypothetical protein n=1 Tax=Roseovarius salinarum TaxID=1981892 RepID=UPI000C33040C|nr:hypothetical protein [Roseovarius salinarum]